MKKILPGHGVFPGCNFEVSIGRVIKMNFMKISGLSTGIEYEIIPDGGYNDWVHIVEKPRRKAESITFSKGIPKNNGQLNLSWLTPGVKLHDIMISVKDGRRVRKIFFMEEGILSDISFSDLDARSDEVFVKYMKMQHAGLTEISR